MENENSNHVEIIANWQKIINKNKSKVNQVQQRRNAITMIMVQHLVAASAHTFVNTATQSPSPSPPTNNLQSPLASPAASISSQPTSASSPLSSPLHDREHNIERHPRNIDTTQSSSSNRSTCSPLVSKVGTPEWSQTQSQISSSEEDLNTKRSDATKKQQTSAICEGSRSEEVATSEDFKQRLSHNLVYRQQLPTLSPANPTPCTSPALSSKSVNQEIPCPPHSPEAANSQDCRQQFTVLYNHLRQQPATSRQNTLIDIHQQQLAQPQHPQYKEGNSNEIEQQNRRSVITSREEEDSLSQERSSSENLDKQLEEQPSSDHYHSDDEDFDDEVPLDLSLPTKLARNRARTYSGTESDDSGSGATEQHSRHHHHHHHNHLHEASRRLKPEERKAAYKKSLMKRYCKYKVQRKLYVVSSTQSFLLIISVNNLIS